MTLTPQSFKKFKGVKYQHYSAHQDKDDALDQKRALVSDGYKARFTRDSIYGLYHVYVIAENIRPVQSLSDSDVLPDLTSIRYVAGLDFLKVSLWLDWGNLLLLESIRKIKESFSSDDLTDGQGMYRSIDFGHGYTFNVQRRGAGNYPYVLKCGDITLMFSNHKVDSQYPNCRIEIGSVSCWVPGAFDIFERIFSWLIDHAVVKEQKVMEAHATVDLLGVDFNLTGLSDLRRWITRSNKGRQCFEKYQYNYISFGKGQIMLRCYNKTGELKPGSAKAIAFNDLWSSHLAGLPPNPN
ncbi:MAG: hypothetical protein D3906_15305, partial [Candidatus Electrothrix sp. AUS1_2]|nr:hypothetical protein [Candidatus Electrothrix sp. AUS1_2]